MGYINIFVRATSSASDHSLNTYFAGTFKSWDQYPKFPICSLRTAFTRFLDITTPPSLLLLKILAAQATKDCDKERLETLTDVSNIFFQR